MKPLTLKPLPLKPLPLKPLPLKSLPLKPLKPRLLAGVLGILATLLVIVAQPWTPAWSGAPPQLGINDYSQNEAPFTLPFHLVDGFVMIDGRVNGVSGRFLWDTATPWGVYLNNHAIPLSNDTFIMTGHAGSGQEMAMYTQNRPIETVTLADQIRFENLNGILHTDWSFTETTFGPNFLGSIGHEFTQHYLFTLDYVRQQIQCYSFDQAETLLADYESAGRLVAVIPFTSTDEDSRKPMFDLTLGSETLHGFWDTGNLGDLHLTAEAQENLTTAGLLTLETSDFWYGSPARQTFANITGLSLDSRPLADIQHLSYTLGDDNTLGMGYQFLKHYITVWNYQDQTLALVRP